MLHDMSEIKIAVFTISQPYSTHIEYKLFKIQEDLQKYIDKLDKERSKSWGRYEYKIDVYNFDKTVFKTDDIF